MGVPFVGEAQQHHDRHARTDEVGDERMQPVGLATLEEVADRINTRVAWTGDSWLQYVRAATDIGASAELHPEQHVDGVAERIGEVDDRRVERDEVGT